ncbi:hypothetical protein KY285_024020 [Solanum tuberosum]|nr:hypothetical protein KY289_024376 [Solanum tuberosum]KAH0676219.1 hypothetical protein KY285_024020 [Solanum tuberosum]
MTNKITPSIVVDYTFVCVGGFEFEYFKCDQGIFEGRLPISGYYFLDGLCQGTLGWLVAPRVMLLWYCYKIGQTDSCCSNVLDCDQLPSLLKLCEQSLGSLLSKKYGLDDERQAEMACEDDIYVYVYQVVQPCFKRFVNHGL